MSKKQHIIAVVNQKGGSGKTTLSTNLARAFQMDGKSVLLVDTDRQGTANQWRARQGEDLDIDVIQASGKRFDQTIRRVEGFDVVIIDGAPNVHEETVAAIRAADLVLMPVQPSAADIWSVASIAELIQARRRVSGEPEAAFVVWRAISRTRADAEVSEALAGYEPPVLAARGYQRIVYAEALGNGSSVLDMEPSGKAAEEIRSIYSEVRGFLGGAAGRATAKTQNERKR